MTDDRDLPAPVALARRLVQDAELHALCGAIAFFSLLSFYPGAFLLLSLLGRLPWDAPRLALLEALRMYYPAAQEFLLRNLGVSVVQYGRDLPWSAALWILVGAAGVFIPLETVLNRAFGFRRHRPYLWNQAVGTALSLATAAIAVLALLAAGAVRAAVEAATAPGFARSALSLFALRGFAVLGTAAVVLLWFRFLPNGRVPLRAVLVPAFWTTLAVHLVHLGYLLVLPRLALPRVHGPFYVSAGFALLAYALAFVLVGGALLAGRHSPGAQLASEIPPEEEADGTARAG